jgi:hypothetical protein
VISTVRARRALGCLLLTLAAAWVGLRFRALPPAVDLRAMTWDAASHALIGLDIFDSIRRFEPLRLLLRLQEEHWWPPLFGLLSLPAYLFGGRQLSSPSLVSLASYCLMPAVAWLTIRRLTRVAALFAWGLVAIFFLRSPTLLEMSAWSMLEPAAGLFALGAFCCFLAEPQSRTRNWAYGFAGASTLLKYHYGFFLLVTLGVATIAELPADERRSLCQNALARLREKKIWIPLGVLAAAIVTRRIAEIRDPHPPIPSVPNLIWFGYVVALLIVLVQWMRTRRAPWSTLPVTLQRFITCGLAWPLIWCIDPANVHAWYRELGVTTDPHASVIEQLRLLPFYFTRDYFLGSLILAIVLVGVVFSLVDGIRRRNVGLLALTLHAIWPVAVMALSSYRIESRFLSTMVVCLLTSAAAGWTLFVERRGIALRIGVSAGVIALLVGDQSLRAADWQRELVTRRIYCYASSDPPDRFVRETVRAFSTGDPVVIVLPQDIEVVAPTIRLGLRIDMKDVRPDLIDVERRGSETLFAKRLRAFPRGLVGAETDPATLRRLIEANGLRVVSESSGPAIPGSADRSLLIARVERRLP